MRILIAVALFATMVVSARSADLPTHGLLPKIDPIGSQLTPTRAARKHDRFHWYELSDTQAANFVRVLSAIPMAYRRPVLILCSPSIDCRDLAEDIELALTDAGWLAQIDVPMDLRDGLHCTVKSFCDLLKSGTGIGSYQDADEDPAHIILNFGRKGR